MCLPFLHTSSLRWHGKLGEVTSVQESHWEPKVLVGLSFSSGVNTSHFRWGHNSMVSDQEHKDKAT